jgi:hypothetical protein
MSIGLRADSGGNSGAVTINGTDKLVITNAGNITATTFTGALVGNASTATALSTSTGTAPVYGVRAWVNFDGTRNVAGAADATNTNRFIRGSGNVTNVLRTATGRYTVYFNTAMTDANYAVTFSVRNSAAGAGAYIISNGDSTAPDTASFTVTTLVNANGAAADLQFINAIVVG